MTASTHDAGRLDLYIPCRCTAWQASERPSLGSEVLPALSRLVGRAEGAVAGYSKAHDADPPAFLLCPITQVGRPAALSYSCLVPGPCLLQRLLRGWLHLTTQALFLPLEWFSGSSCCRTDVAILLFAQTVGPAALQ